MSEGIVTASYIGATVLFILALGGLSNQETSRRVVMIPRWVDELNKRMLLCSLQRWIEA